MLCPFCHAQDTKVVDSRLANEGEQIRRRRECVHCGERFTTYEVAELSYPRIIKREGLCEQFQEPKLRGGILRALEKRPVSTQAIEDTITELLSQIRNAGEREISSQLLGEWVMERLKALDQVAYVRFASVYRRFADLSEFQAEINRLQES